jgi:hypothetical protein
MPTEPSDHLPLPDEAVDRRDRIELRADRTTRWLAIGLGTGLVIAAVVVFVVVERQVVGWVPTVAIGAGLVAAAVSLVVGAYRRLQFDASGVTDRAGLRTRSLAWSQVREARVEERERSVPLAGISRRVGWLRVDAGIGGGPARRRRTGVGRSTRRERFYALQFRGVSNSRRRPTEIGMELHHDTPEGGEALLSTIRRRGWLPEEVTVHVDRSE